MKNYKHEALISAPMQEQLPSTTSTANISDTQYSYGNKTASSVPYVANSSSGNSFPHDYEHEENHAVPQQPYQQQSNQPMQPQASTMQQVPVQSLSPYIRNTEMNTYSQFHDSNIPNWNQQYNYQVEYRTDNYTMNDRDQQVANCPPILRSPFPQDMYYHQQFVDQNQFNYNQNYSNFQFGYPFQPAVVSQPLHPNDPLVVPSTMNSTVLHDHYEGQTLKRKADTTWEDWGKDQQIFDNYLNSTNPVVTESYASPVDAVLLDNNHASKAVVKDSEVSEANVSHCLYLPSVLYQGLTYLTGHLEKNVQFHQNTPEAIKNPFQLSQDLNVNITLY